MQRLTPDGHALFSLHTYEGPCPLGEQRVTLSTPRMTETEYSQLHEKI